MTKLQWDIAFALATPLAWPTVTRTPTKPCPLATEHSSLWDCPACGHRGRS